MKEMEKELSALLRRPEVKVMLDNAMLTRNALGDPKQSIEARRQIRMTMYKHALGQITDEERQRILNILRPCCPEIFYTAPTTEERQKECTGPEDSFIE